MSKAWCSLLMLGFVSLVLGQEKYILSFQGQQEQAKEYQFNSPKALEEAVLKKRLKLIQQGFVFANIDSLVWVEKSATAFLFKGNKYEKLTIQADESSARLLRKAGLTSFNNVLRLEFIPKKIENIFSSLLDYLENNGFPFASIQLSLDSLSSSGMIADLVIEKGPEVSWTAVHIKGDVPISEKLVSNLIQIKEGDYYEEKKLQNIDAIFKQVLFIDEIKPHELLFTNEGAEVFLYLKSKPVSLINGIIGIQPNTITGKNVFTGDVKLKLQNTLLRGELFNLNWRSLQPGTQDLNVTASYPFIFNSRFGTEGNFKLYKRDSSFLTTNAKVGIQYYFKGNNHLKFFYESENSNLLSGAMNSDLANLSSVNNNRYGMGFSSIQLDYLPNPSKGAQIIIEGQLGKRTTYFTDSTTTSLSYKFKMNAECYLPITRRNVLRLANQTTSYYADQIYSNELDRFGGLNTQRGFDEETLFASTRTSFTVEYRFLVDQNSHAFAFFDQTIYENNTDTYYLDSPFGTGVGFSFGTGLGIFSISYAIGKQLGNPMLLRDGKIHFGYVAFF